jgi:hypothetical protein
MTYASKILYVRPFALATAKLIGDIGNTVQTGPSFYLFQKIQKKNNQIILDDIC